VWSCLVFSTVDDYGCVRWRGGRCNGSADGRKSWCTGYEVTGRCQGGEPWTAFVCHLEPTALQVLLRTACHHGYSWSSSHQPYVSLSKPGCMGLLGVQKLGGRDDSAGRRTARLEGSARGYSGYSGYS
ncbi:unnamed protein product, partial [Ectocarpus fasciculatus]